MSIKELRNSVLESNNTVNAQYDEFWEECIDFNKYNPGARHRRNWVLNKLSELSFDSIADIGCGTGRLLSEIKSTFPHVKNLTGFDVSPKAVSIAKKTFPDFNFYTANLDSETLNGQFDIVLCCEVIEHLHNQEDAFQKLMKIVKPGGHLIITCPTGRIHKTEQHFGHIKHPSILELTKWTHKYDGSHIDAYQWGYPMYKLTKWATNLNSDFSLNTFAQGKYGFFQKVVSNIIYLVNHLNASNHKKGVQLYSVIRKKMG